MSRFMGVTMLVAFAVTTSASAGSTLELRITGDGSPSVVVFPGDSIYVAIEGRITGDVTGGLALWSTDLRNTGDIMVDLCDRGWLFFDAPAGDMQMFKRDLGLTNPGPGGASDTSGYGGTCDGAGGLLQIGGAQNTIHNTGPTLYPSGSPIAAGVGEGGWTVLAEASIWAPEPYNPYGFIALEPANAVAVAIDTGQSGPVYSVSPMDVSVVGSLQIMYYHHFTLVTGAWSCGFHAGASNQDLCIDVFGGPPVEPRMIDAVTRVYLVVETERSMTTATVTTVPAIAGVSATADGSNEILVSFPMAAPTDETCYAFDFAGSMAVDGSVEPVGNDFCVCYLEGDVDRSGEVNAGDRNRVVSPANFWLDPDEALEITADVDRSGTINAGDRNMVTGAQNFWHTASPCP